MHVIVIGGGFAGLAASTQLAEEGHQVTLLERRDHLGGRAFPAAAGGEGLREPPPRLFFGYYRAARTFLERIGTAGKLHFPPRMELPIADVRRGGKRERSLTALSGLPAPLDRLGALATYGGLSLIDRGLALRVVAAITAPSRFAPAPREGETVAQWLTALSQTERAREALWDPLVLLTLQDDPRAASAELFAAALKALCFGPADSACIAVPPTDAQQLYIDDARRFLESRGATLRLGAEVTSIRARALGERLLFDGVELAGGEVLGADAAIAAVPAAVLLALIPSALREHEPYFQAIARLRSAAALTVHVRLDRLVSRAPLVALTGSRFHWLLARSDGVGQGGEVWLQAWGAGALLGYDDDELVRLGMETIVAALPGSAAARVLGARVLREPDALVAHPAGSESARPRVRSPIEGLLIAGEYARTGLPANLESAARAAQEAAALALEYEPPAPAPSTGFIPANRLVRRSPNPS